MFTLTKQTKKKGNTNAKNFGIYMYAVSRTHTHTRTQIAIEMRCKQSDIFAKFMYLRHWVILSLFGEMCSRTARTQTRISCVTSALSTPKQRSKQEVICEMRSSKKKRKFTRATERICNVNATQKKKILLLWCREKSSYHVLSD